MTAIPAATQSTPAGIDITSPATAAASSMTMTNTGKEGLLVQNNSVASINVTITCTKTLPDGGGNLTVTNRVVAVAAGVTKLLGPFPTDVYNDSSQTVTFAFSAVTTVVVQAIRIG